MAQSSYDRNGDGRCDARECRAVLTLASERGFGPAAAEQVAAWLDAIGIELRMRVRAVWSCPVHETRRLPLFMGCGFGYDFLNASTFLPFLFDSSEISGGYGANMSLVGATPSQLRRWGYEVTQVPSADDRIDRCAVMVGADQTECWADLDRYLMEDVVPVIPYAAETAAFVVSKRIAIYSYSVATGKLALDRMALVEGSD
jgi:hypothetical protein